jgi:hypothetical protein
MNQIVNGFEIIQDLGVVYKNPGVNRNKTHYVIVICKHCKREWKTSYYTLSKIDGCGCTRPSQLKPLPEYINGFKTIKCHGYDTNRGIRWATVECKVCKNGYEVDPNKLQYRKHCGCIIHGTIATKYEKSHPRLAGIFRHMMGRCYTQSNLDYHNYGARGIKVCDEWKNDRNKFCEWALNNGYQDNLSIERIDSKKGYGPENCKWANAEEQARNTRRVKMTIEGARSMRKIYKESPCYSTILKLAKEYKVSDATVYLIIQNKTWKE